jgi:hypothetical protein
LTLAEKVVEAAGTTSFWEDPLRVARLVPVVRHYTSTDRSHSIWKRKLDEDPTRSLGLLNLYFPSLRDRYPPTNEEIERALNALDLEDLARACEVVVASGGTERFPAVDHFLAWWKSSHGDESKDVALDEDS